MIMIMIIITYSGRFMFASIKAIAAGQSVPKERNPYSSKMTSYIFVLKLSGLKYGSDMRRSVSLGLNWKHV